MRLSVRELTKRHGSNTVVSSVSHVFEDGKITTVVGPSGAGKSTLLAMIAGLTPPDAGAVMSGDRDITSLPAEQRNMGLVFQNYALFPHLSVRENVEFGLRVRGLSKTTRRTRAEETLRLVRILPLAERRITQISGGEQQRVALARALAFRPHILLMDEPLSALDAKLREDLRTELFRLLQSLSLTTVYVTHDQVEAMSLGNTMLVMNNGRFEQSGRPLDVYRRPANAFVAAFLGSANIVEGECVESDNRRRIQLPFAVIDAPSYAQTGACYVMIRPEDMRLAYTGAADFHGSVDSTLFLGNQIRLNLTAIDQRLILDVENEVVIDQSAPIPVRINSQKVFVWPRVNHVAPL